MKQFQSIIVNVYIKEDESYEEIKEGLLSLFPFNLQDEKIQINDEEAEGFFEKKIHILKVELRKDKHTNQFFEELLEKLGEEQVTLLHNQVDSRLDEHCFFFIRLDLAKVLLGEYTLTDSGACYHIKMHIASYPRKKEIAKEIIEKALSRNKEKTNS